jgi:hypothetical protein
MLLFNLEGHVHDIIERRHREAERAAVRLAARRDTRSSARSLVVRRWFGRG